MMKDIRNNIVSMILFVCALIVAGMAFAQEAVVSADIPEPQQL
jgi:hypothetical protein